MVPSMSHAELKRYHNIVSQVLAMLRMKNEDGTSSGSHECDEACNFHEQLAIELLSDSHQMTPRCYRYLLLNARAICESLRAYLRSYPLLSSESQEILQSISAFEADLINRHLQQPRTFDQSNDFPHDSSVIQSELERMIRADFDSGFTRMSHCSKAVIALVEKLKQSVDLVTELDDSPLLSGPAMPDQAQHYIKEMERKDQLKRDTEHFWASVEECWFKAQEEGMLVRVTDYEKERASDLERIQADETIDEFIRKREEASLLIQTYIRALQTRHSYWQSQSNPPTKSTVKSKKLM